MELRKGTSLYQTHKTSHFAVIFKLNILRSEPSYGKKLEKRRNLLDPSVELAPKSSKFCLVNSNLVIPHGNIISYLESGGTYPKWSQFHWAIIGSDWAFLSFEVIPDPIPKNADSIHLYSGPACLPGNLPEETSCSLQVPLASFMQYRAAELMFEV